MSESFKPSRRSFILGGANFGLAIGVSGCGSDSISINSQTDNSRVNVSDISTSSSARPQQIAPLFLDEQELATLTALLDQLIPNTISPGASDVGCAQYIQRLLSAFSFEPPLIFAGGAFSNRGGASANNFEEFIELDSYEELAWRTKIEGSSGLAQREFNGVIPGWQEIYRGGLAALNQLAANTFQGQRFETLATPVQLFLVKTNQDAAVQALIDLAFPHALQGMYGAPEYGGNSGTQAWKVHDFDGDVQPRGYTSEQVVEPDNPGLNELLGFNRFNREQANFNRQTMPAQAALLPVPSVVEDSIIHQTFRSLIGLNSDEFNLAMMMDSQSSWKRMRAHAFAKNARLEVDADDLNLLLLNIKDLG